MVGAGVSAPTTPLSSPPGAAVVAGTAVLEAPAASTQVAFLKEDNITKLWLPLSANEVNDRETDLSWWGLQLWLMRW